MLYAIHYTTRSSAATKADTIALMTEFAKRGEMPGSIAHYVYPAGVAFSSLSRMIRRFYTNRSSRIRSGSSSTLSRRSRSTQQFR